MTAAILPAETWAVILGYLPFDDVLSFTAVNKHARHDVPPHLEHLLITSGNSMNIAPTAIHRFTRVKDIYVYSLLEQVEAPSDCNIRSIVVKVDKTSAQTFLPFIENLAAKSCLVYCHVGRCLSDSHNFYNRDMIRYFPSTYDEFLCPADRDCIADLISQICCMFGRGWLMPCLQFEGLLAEQSTPRCIWRDVPKIEWWPERTTEQPCQVCDMVCQRFPPLSMITLRELEVPCICHQDRMIMAYSQLEPDSFMRVLTALLQDELATTVSNHAPLPPDYKDMVCVATYSQKQYNRMRRYISLGADVHTPNMIQGTLLVDNGDIAGTEGKRVVSKETYAELKDLGLDVSEDRFMIVDIRSEQCFG